MKPNPLVDVFLQHFKIALTHAAMYFRQHPSFCDSVASLHQALEDFFKTSDSLCIGVTTNSFLIDGIHYNDRLYLDAIHQLHRRRVKSITIAKTVTTSELENLCAVLTAPLKDIMAQGGVGATEGIEHISIEELDYLELLSSCGGEEDKDLWRVLIEHAHEGKAGEKEFNTVIEHFGDILQKFSMKDIAHDSEFAHKLADIVIRLKDSDITKFEANSKLLASFIMKGYPHQDNDALRQVVKDFFEVVPDRILGEVLWEDNFANKKLNGFVLELFSTLVDKGKQSAIARSLTEKLTQNQYTLSDTAVKEKFLSLVSEDGEFFISPAYKDTLLYFMKSIEGTGSFSIDNIQTRRHALGILLDLLLREKKPSDMGKILFHIHKEWPDIVSQQKAAVVRDFLEAIDERLKDDADSELISLCRENRERLLKILEEKLLAGDVNYAADDIEYFLKVIGQSRFAPDIYVDKIIASKGETRREIARLFYNFFPEKISLLTERLKTAITKVDMAEDAIDIIKGIDSPHSLEFLKYVFYHTNPFLQIESIRAMQHFQTIDSDFLFMILKGNNLLQKRQTLQVICSRSSSLRRKAVEIMLNVLNFFGIKDGLVSDNVRLIEEAGITEAVARLERLSKAIYFPWQGRLRDAVAGALKTLRAASSGTKEKIQQKT